ncbi:hypothetical protein BDU57DRAFT_339669 [Ampelomyces quisqualis]|uniref:Uncharacterized protein n=1 Tax=Ampelomyces quisqualis TaxID=50730 RepID=A0A6A5QC47_AMPQU|nr:hypothetical protein BDU57DRAFT_339669 [Ampelomyces quisqualis]
MGALLGFEFPSCAVLPVILMVSRTFVTTRSLKLTETTEGYALLVALAVEMASVVGVLPVLASKTTGFPLLEVTEWVSRLIGASSEVEVDCMSAQS